MGNKITRRDFLKLSGALAVSPWLSQHAGSFPLSAPVRPIGWGRVTISAIYLYRDPDYSAEREALRYRDQLLAIFEEVISPNGPDYNPLWYRVSGGYVHSSRIQRVEPRPENEVVHNIPQDGILAEVTVPYSRSYRLTRTYGWVPVYRLYYGSTHWVMGVDEGPDQAPWYRLLDHLLNVEYHVPAHHLRLIPYTEYSPIARDVPPEEKRIIVSISQQTLSAYEGDKEVMKTRISSGLPSDPSTLEEGVVPTDTPIGSFWIQNKMPSRHMGDGHLTDDIEAYELPGVPWTSLFHETGVGFHGTYWHDNFGRKMSHGCVNMRTEDALWLFRWSDPVFDGSKYYQAERGTGITVYA